MNEGIRQEAPWPDALAAAVSSIDYKAGWRFSLEQVELGRDCKCLALVVRIDMPDTYHPERRLTPCHPFPVPPLSYDERSWRRWLFERIMDVERHEAMEWFRLGQERPYSPQHDRHDRYTVYERGTLEA